MRLQVKDTSNVWSIYCNSWQLQLGNVRSRETSYKSLSETNAVFHCAQRLYSTASLFSEHPRPWLQTSGRDFGDERVFMRRTSTALMKWNRIGAVFDHDVTDTRLKATWGRLGAAHDSGGGGVLAAQHGHKRTEWVENQDTLLVLITSPNLDQSSHFFHLGSKRVMK